MFFGIQLGLICVVLFQGGPGGGGGTPPLEACTCLMVDGTQSCKSVYGTRPGLIEPPSDCDDLCQATVPPSCPESAPIDWTVYVSEDQWKSDFVHYKVPGPGESGMERRRTSEFNCSTDFKCDKCKLFENIQPNGWYCVTSETPQMPIGLFGLCTNAMPCTGSGGVE
jgi:hypothetical protein